MREEEKGIEEEKEINGCVSGWTDRRKEGRKRQETDGRREVKKHRLEIVAIFIIVYHFFLMNQ